MNKLEKLSQLINDIRWQENVGIHTMSICQTCKITGTRGGGKCGKCLATELGELVGNGPALSFYNAVRHQNEIVSRMQEKFE